MFIKYSTGVIPFKKRRGKGLRGKKTADTYEADVDVFDESGSDSEPARKQTSSRGVIKKKVTITVDDNIIPEPDIALELGKSISLTQAAEEEAARQVHATHARIVTESVPEPARRRPSDIAFRDTSSVTKKLSPETSQKLKGVQKLTPKEQLVADTMQALKERVPDEEKVTSEANVILEWGSEQESENSEKDDDDEKIEWVDTDEEEQKNDDDDDKSINLEKTDDEETYDEFVHSGEYNEEVKDDTKKAEFPPTSSNLSVSLVLTPIPETHSVPPATTLLPPPSVSTISHVPLQTTTPIPTPPITTETPPVTTIPDPLHAIIQRVYVLEKDVQELKEADNTTTLRAILKSEIPLAVHAFLGSILGDALHKNALEKTPLLAAQTSSQAQSSLKAAESLSEYKLKTILFEKMDKIRSYLTHDKH
ncbi:hypothetical protein Tco_0554433 [Tanacetum coccineum]